MNGEIEFKKIECANCYMPFYVTKLFEKARREDHQTFWCPNGHTNYFPGLSETEKLQKQLETAKKDNDFWQERFQSEKRRRENTENSLIAVRGHLTRAKNQIQKGKCPNCEEHFSDLENHIKEKHPDFDLELSKAPEKPVAPAKKGKRSIIRKPLPKSKKLLKEKLKAETNQD